MSHLDIPRTHSDDPATDPPSSATVAADKYDQMLALADLFDSSGSEMRTRARLGAEILHEPRVWPEYHPGYFGAFVRDPDGNNVEAVHHTFPGAEPR